ncbi:TPA: hypothetical protein ACORDH_002791 [Bacillus cereus]
MVEMLRLNYEESARVHKENESRLQKNMCYNNVFNVMTFNNDKFDNGEWRVAYGYWTVVDGVMARHCYIVDRDKNVIDPTALLSEKNMEKVKYLTFKIFEDMDDYLNLIWEHDREPALYQAFPKEEEEAHKYAMQNSLILIQ